MQRQHHGPCDEMMKLDKSLTITFIDYGAVFESVSHKFIDTTLTSAGVCWQQRKSNLPRSLQVRISFTTVKSTNGRNTQSVTFPIRRGVVQGDVTSPLYFILTLELILRRHDSLPDKGVPMTDTMIIQWYIHWDTQIICPWMKTVMKKTSQTTPPEWPRSRKGQKKMQTWLFQFQTQKLCTYVAKILSPQWLNDPTRRKRCM